MYINRNQQSLINQYVKNFPVVALMGPRQAGKSTLLLHELKDTYRYVSFDDFETIAFFEDDPKGFMQTYQDKVIFDEVQKVPALFSHIKQAVDKERDAKGRYILTGSSQLMLMKNISESLAGRIGLLNLLPLQWSEIPHPQRNNSILQGCYPELVKNNFEISDPWYNAYLATYLEKDIRVQNNIVNLSDFRRFLSLLAANVSQTITLSRFANDLGVQVATLKKWLSVLEASYIVFFLPPYHNNLGKRIVKSPKLYFYDTGLVSFLLNVNKIPFSDENPLVGPLFENYIIADIKKDILHKDKRASLYYYRNTNQEEVDLIVDKGAAKDFIEIKHSASFRPAMLKTLKQFQDSNHSLYILYNGEKFPYEGYNIIPFEDYLSS